MPWVEETWTPDKAGVADRISLDATNVQDFKMLQDAWAAAGSAAARFARPLGDKYNVSTIVVNMYCDCVVC